MKYIVTNKLAPPFSTLQAAEAKIYMRCVLIYMATIYELCEGGKLKRIEVLEDDELPVRYIYGTPEFIDWLDNGLPSINHTPEHDSLKPIEQVFSLFSEYEIGESFPDDRRFKPLTYSPDYYVWEMKTSHVRIFGWFPCKSSFICCYGGDANEIKLKSLYSQYILRTQYVRNLLPLDEPKFLSSRKCSDVL